MLLHSNKGIGALQRNGMEGILLITWDFQTPHHKHDGVLYFFGHPQTGMLHIHECLMLEVQCCVLDDGGILGRSLVGIP